MLYTRYVDTDEGVARNELHKLALSHVFRTGRAHGEDHVANICGTVVYDDLDAFWWFEAELAHHRARFSDGARSVLEALVPVWRAAEDGPRVAGAQGADDQVVHPWRVLHDDELGGVLGLHAEPRSRGLGVGEQQLLEVFVHPGAG